MKGINNAGRVSHITESHVVSTEYIPRLTKGDDRTKRRIHKATSVSKEMRRTQAQLACGNFVASLGKGGCGEGAGEGAAGTGLTLPWVPVRVMQHNSTDGRQVSPQAAGFGIHQHHPSTAQHTQLDWQGVQARLKSCSSTVNALPQQTRTLGYVTDIHAVDPQQTWPY